MLPRLPRAVYVFQAGLVLNAFRNGAANPFLVIYLHDVRGIPLGLAGLAGSASAFCGLGAMLAGLTLSTVGFALYPPSAQASSPAGVLRRRARPAAAGRRWSGS